MASLEKASWIAGIAAAAVALIGLVWSVWPHSKEFPQKPDDSKQIIQAAKGGQIAKVTGSYNTTIQGSGNVITFPGGPPQGIDTYVITQEIADLPRNGLEKAFDDSIDGDGQITFCGGGAFTFRNMSNKSIVLSACVPQTDNCSTLASLAPEERRQFVAKDFGDGRLDIFDTEGRFQVQLATEIECKAPEFDPAKQRAEEAKEQEEARKYFEQLKGKDHDRDRR